MGQSKSKPREKSVEEEKTVPTNFVAKSKEKVMGKESRQLDKEALNQPADSVLFAAGTSKHSRPSSSSEDKSDTKQKSSKKRNVIPQIIITHASNETLISYGLPENEEQRTIHEQADWGPYYRHRSPSTIAAYEGHNPE
ncbi:spermatogenesis-associated protein 33 isoform X1 [Alexandromys fortis]|uniref:spermatogenesis-associated protein 33 isoform X1 n=1 Tax=Alexandromys fortis TaxID=100897 RepID=UPI0021534696|nr:spermatogenesis-associated protein 33 isoform X1 [Microtus fortis]